MNSWLSGWTKKSYKEVCKDLCTCFIKRGFSLSDDRGYEALITSDTCMYISSFEKMRKEVIERTSIVCFIDTRGTNAHPDVFDANAGWVLWNHPCANIKGSYFKLNHPIPEKGQRLLEALANPDCGWFYRCDSNKFEVIPGCPIAYWASEAVKKSFLSGRPLSSFAKMPYGFKTGNNDRFLRLWWECSNEKVELCATSNDEAKFSSKKWFPYNKGGSFRKWYGNNEYLLNYEHGGEEVIGQSRIQGRSAADYDHNLLFKPVVTWSRISSGRLHMRFSPKGAICDMTGSGYYGNDGVLSILQAFCNSSVALLIASLLSPTLDFQPGQIGAYPILEANQEKQNILDAVEMLRDISKEDWDSFEISWDFSHHPLI